MPIHDKAPIQWTTDDPLAECRCELHKKAFGVHHPLAGHREFSIEALEEAAMEASRRKGDLYVDAGNFSFADKWGTTPKPDMTIHEIFDRIETAGAWLVMKHVESNRAYKALLDEFVEFLLEIAGPEGSRLLSNAEMIVLVTSPRRKSAFHFDAEVNFLAQVQGSKDIWICDPLDRSVTTEEEIERYYSVANNAGTFKPHAETVARRFTQRPGDAVHIPTHASHWVQNHDSVSVSVSLNMEFPRRFADTYRANYYLRRFGIKPRPPGQSDVVDRSKAVAINGLRHVKSLVKR
ncbi:MAG TPA: cupin-like domain-containing protein [Paraburkholderia sp.]